MRKFNSSILIDFVFKKTSFLDDLDRLSGVDYLPSEQDILRTTYKTTGIIEESFTYKERPFV
jgi:hypothetical protein